MEHFDRESTDFDVLIVGAQTSGLSVSSHLMEQAHDAGNELMVCVMQKGSEVGVHILSCPVFELRALQELFPDWAEYGAPLTTPATRDDLYLLKDAEKAQKLPNVLAPSNMHNTGGQHEGGEHTLYVISAGNLCRWLSSVHDTTPDHATLKPAEECEKIDYPKPDGKHSFDKPSSVFLPNTNHGEDQPCHLKLADPELPIRDNLPEYAEPAQRYCPAGVYEVVEGDDGTPRFQINFHN